MKQTAGHRLRRLAWWWVLALALAVAHPLYAQSLRLVSERVETVTAPVATPDASTRAPTANARLILTFTAGDAAVGDEQLTLRFPNGALQVLDATLRPAVVPAVTIPATWDNTPEGAIFLLDVLAPGDYELAVDVATTTAVRDATIDWAVIADDAVRGDPLALSLESLATLAQLAGATATATPSPTATFTSTATATPTTTTATATSTVAATGTLAVSPTVAATPAPTTTPESDGGILQSDLLIPILLTALFIIAALLIALLFLRRRPAAPRRAPGPPPRGAPETVTTVLGRPDAVAEPYLELESDPSRTFPIAAVPFTIGRGPGNTLVVDETFPQWETVSRDHAIITRHPQGYVVEDRGSQNGVRVNGRPTPRNLLRDGWPVAIGGVGFRFVDPSGSN